MTTVNVNLNGINELDFPTGVSSATTANGKTTINLSGSSGITQLTGDVAAGPGSGSVPATVQGLQTVPIDTITPTNEQFLLYNATSGKWTPTTLLASSNATYFLDQAASDVVGYQTLINSFPTSAQTTYTATGTSGSGQVLAAAFVGPVGGMGLTIIPAGMWVPSLYMSVDALTQSPQAVIKIYTRTAAGVETLQLTQTVNLTSTTPILYDQTTELPNINVSPTDRMVVKVYLQAGGAASRTLTLYVDGSVNNSHIHFPTSGVNSIQAEFVNAQTGTTYTVQSTDRRYLVTLSNASPVAVTLPQATNANFPNGWFADFANLNAGLVTITPTTSTIDGQASIDLDTNQGIRIVSNGTNYYTVRGRVSVKTIGIVIDGGGSTPSTGVKGYVDIPFNANITGWTLIADQSGSASIDVWFIAGSGAPPTAPNIPLAANKISASAPITMTTAQSASGGSSAVSTWAKTLTRWGTLAFNLSSVTTCQRLTAQIQVVLT